MVCVRRPKVPKTARPDAITQFVVAEDEIDQRTVLRPCHIQLTQRARLTWPQRTPCVGPQAGRIRLLHICTLADRTAADQAEGPEPGYRLSAHVVCRPWNPLSAGSSMRVHRGEKGTVGLQPDRAADLGEGTRHVCHVV